MVPPDSTHTFGMWHSERIQALSPLARQHTAKQKTASTLDSDLTTLEVSRSASLFPNFCKCLPGTFILQAQSANSATVTTQSQPPLSHSARVRQQSALMWGWQVLVHSALSVDGYPVQAQQRLSSHPARSQHERLARNAIFILLQQGSSTHNALESGRGAAVK